MASLLLSLSSELEPKELMGMLIDRLVGEHTDRDDIAVVIVENMSTR
jgi:hypothetical protein